MSFIFDKVKDAVKEAESSVKSAVADHRHLHTHGGDDCSETTLHHLHRFQSFAPEREGNDVKWYVDACGYMWAVSVAIENAKSSIWILDWWLSPELYLRRPPSRNEQYRLDRLLFAAANRGVKVNIIVYKEVTQALTLSSHHTKHWLEDNDKTGNIRVFRHPDHTLDRRTLSSNFLSSFKDSVLYWAHHEKLCLVDAETAFMGGLDLCYGRWDTNHHSIADAHPSDLNEIVFPGQDYNNARIMDFQDVSHWENNKLDRKYNSRMGWTDVSLSLHGPAVEDLRHHFAQRWNYIHFSKYHTRENSNYQPIVLPESRFGIIGRPYQRTEPGAEAQGEGQYEGFRDHMKDQFAQGLEKLRQRKEQLKEEGDELLHHDSHHGLPADNPNASNTGPMHCQIARSCCSWSHGVHVEHSIANAYIKTIKNSKHFIYVENQFFITATSEAQDPVKNRIGAAIADRIIRAARHNEKWHMIVAIPSVPGFAGDLKADEALGTRAIMEFQYNSICRSGHSIMETVEKEGIDPKQYIRFYNLRSYDRINSGKSMRDVEEKAGLSYEQARQGHDIQHAENEGLGGNTGAFDRYQEAAREVQGGQVPVLDSVASCYMQGGEDIRNVSWNGDAESELDAFVSEELYIHSKLLIADDRRVICGSANLNDRSQLGTHDSEIAIVIEDQSEIDSFMAGKPWRATKFAASLRRKIFRKHLGLIYPQDYQTPDANFTPIGSDPNLYDWGSREDHAVADPLAPSFLELWNTTAHNNTEAFSRVFHPVPSDEVQNWKDYETFYEKYFAPQEATKEGKEGKSERPSTWKYGHVVKEEFSAGEQGLKEVKEILSRIRGTLVEMPLLFLKDEDIAKEGLGLNALTEDVYT